MFLEEYVASRAENPNGCHGRTDFPFVPTQHHPSMGCALTSRLTVANMWVGGAMVPMDVCEPGVHPDFSTGARQIRDMYANKFGGPPDMVVVQS
jgi:hypothetical protein